MAADIDIFKRSGTKYSKADILGQQSRNNEFQKSFVNFEKISHIVQLFLLLTSNRLMFAEQTYIMVSIS